jgi:uncharacterized membrane protein YeaQ/YmgE (transglycosylase-associated protein family)
VDAIGSFISWLVTAPFACIGWIIIGFIAGALARRIMGSSDAPFVLDVILGIVGAWVGGFILGLLGFRDALDIGFGIGSLITALIGAIVLIFIGRLLTGRR